MIVKKIDGLVSAPYTPMKLDGTVNTGIIKKYADKLKSDRLKGVFVCGTTGEGMFMTSAERMEIAKAWIAEQTEDFRVIVHVGTTSVRQSFELAHHAALEGANAIGCMGPMFLRPSTVKDLVDYCVEVASGAPGLPFYYYHIPSVSGIELPMSEFIEEAKSTIPNLAGIKFTDNNFMDMQKCLDLDNGKWDILNGFDEMLLAGLAVGATGAVGSTYNFMAPLYYDMIDDFRNGNIAAARRKQGRSIQVIEVLNKYGGGIPAGKAFMKETGIDCGPCRLPLKNVAGKKYENFISELESLDFIS
jgi:N-acetylneuraminate lyase